MNFKHGYFRWGKFRKNVYKTFLMEVNFTILLLFPSLSHMGFIFVCGRFWQRRQYREKCKKIPPHEISTFTVIFIVLESYIAIYQVQTH